MIDEKTGEVVELLRNLIRNRCVNDGTSGSETSTAEVLYGVLDHPGIDIEQFEPFPGRASVVAKIEGNRTEKHPAWRCLPISTSSLQARKVGSMIRSPQTSRTASSGVVAQWTSAT